MADDSSVDHTRKPASRPSATASVLSLVHSAELTGRAPKSLADLPRSFVCDRVDGLTSRARHTSEDSSRMSSRLLSLQQIVRQRRCTPSEARELKAKKLELQNSGKKLSKSQSAYVAQLGIMEKQAKAKAAQAKAKQEEDEAIRNAPPPELPSLPSLPKLPF